MPSPYSHLHRDDRFGRAARSINEEDARRVDREYRHGGVSPRPGHPYQGSATTSEMRAAESLSGTTAVGSASRRGSSISSSGSGYPRSATTGSSAAGSAYGSSGSGSRYESGSAYISNGSGLRHESGSRYGLEGSQYSDRSAPSRATNPGTWPRSSYGDSGRTSPSYDPRSRTTQHRINQATDRNGFDHYCPPVAPGTRRPSRRAEYLDRAPPNRSGSGYSASGYSSPGYSESGNSRYSSPGYSP